MKCPVPSRVPGLEVELMAHALCDADASLEDMKHGRRCVLRGCLVPQDRCIAFHQADALVRLFGKVWQRRQTQEAARTDQTDRRFSL